MAASYELINYALRPAKHIERKMLIASLSRMSVFGKLNTFQYVGFGSIAFSDFRLVHRWLGIDTLISIEKDVKNQDRFEFNRPFTCVDMRYGVSGVELQQIDWSRRSIVWMDYDDRLSQDILSDIEYLMMNLCSGSVIIVSVNAKPDPQGEPRLELLRERVGSSNVPIDITKPEQLGGWKLAGVCHRIINTLILDTLTSRNGALGPTDNLTYSQTYHLQYRDGANMLTVGGVVCSASERSKLEGAEFSDFDFVSQGETAYRIEVPILTAKERHHIESQLPSGDVAILHAPGVPETDLRKFAKSYKYFPNFADVDM